MSRDRRFHYAGVISHLRRLAFPFSLARARLARRGGRALLVAVGVAAGAATLAAVLAGSEIAQDRSLARATQRIDPNDRAIRAIWGSVFSGGLPRLDRAARHALAPLPGERPFRVVVFRETSLADARINISGIDDLGRWASVTSGRLPRQCTASRCEVLELAGSTRVPSVHGLRFVVVGHGRLKSQLPLGTFLSSASSNALVASAVAYHRAGGTPFVVANGVRALAAAHVLDGSYRSYAWVRALTPGSVHPWQVGSVDADVTRARARLGSIDPAFDVTAPVDELETGAASARVAGRRLLLIGGEAAALLLAFAIVAAAALRRDVAAAWQRLTWYGARRWQLLAFSTAESAAIAAAGTIVGWLVGAAAGAAVAARAGSPAGAVLSHSVFGGGGIATALVLAAAAAVVLLVALRAGAIELGRLTLTPLDVAALGALAAIVLALVRGSASAGALANERGTATFLLLLPALVAFVAAVAAVRVLVPALRALERTGRRGPLPLRLAALSLARNPGHAAVAVAFLVVSLGLGLFAEAYRATLTRGQQEQAAYAVPADFVLRENLSRLVSVPRAAPPERMRALHAVPVLRLDGDLPRTSESFTLLGVPATALPRTPGWRGDFSRLSLATLSRRLRPAEPIEMRGVRLPRGARELVLPVRTSGADLVLRGTVETRRGDFLPIRFGVTNGPRLKLLRAALPPLARGGTLVSIDFTLFGTGLHGVANGGYDANPVGRGVLAFGRMRPVPLPWDAWIGVGGAHAVAPGRLAYSVTGDVPSRFRARQATDGEPVPVVASPGVAAAADRHGVVSVEVEGQPLTVRVVGVTKRFPSVDGDVVLADRGTVATSMNADVAGSAVTDELWVNGHARAVHRGDLSLLEVSSRRALLRDLRGDPLARGALLVLVAAAVAALVLALVGLLLGIAADARDERGELFDLEAQGAAPATLRRHLRLRTLLVAGAAALGGIATGAILAALVVRIVGVTAQASAAEPPLRLALDWPVLGLAAAAYVLAAAALAAAATRGVFRGAAVRRELA